METAHPPIQALMFCLPACRIRWAGRLAKCKPPRAWVARFAAWSLVLLSVLACICPAHADELVQVAPQRASGSQQPSTQPLFGFLTRPYHAGRYPAVVLLHGCGGFSDHDVAMATRLRSWGYVALALDSLGHENWCGHLGGALAEAFDAYAGLQFLARQSFVQAGNIAVLGYSMGGIAVLLDVRHGMPSLLARGQPGRFRAAIAYYPFCARGMGNFDSPVLVLIGEQDDWASAAACRKMVADRDAMGITHEPARGLEKLVVYPGATHAFDYNEPSRHYLGHLMRYDAAAAVDAEMQVRDFLHVHLAQRRPPSRRRQPRRRAATNRSA